MEIDTKPKNLFDSNDENSDVFHIFTKDIPHHAYSKYYNISLFKTMFANLLSNSEKFLKDNTMGIKVTKVKKHPREDYLQRKEELENDGYIEITNNDDDDDEQTLSLDHDATFVKEPPLNQKIDNSRQCFEQLLKQLESDKRKSLENQDVFKDLLNFYIENSVNGEDFKRELINTGDSVLQYDNINSNYFLSSIDLTNNNVAFWRSTIGKVPKGKIGLRSKNYIGDFLRNFRNKLSEKDGEIIAEKKQIEETQYNIDVLKDAYMLWYYFYTVYDQKSLEEIQEENEARKKYFESREEDSCPTKVTVDYIIKEAKYEFPYINDLPLSIEYHKNEHPYIFDIYNILVDVNNTPNSRYNKMIAVIKKTVHSHSRKILFEKSYNRILRIIVKYEYNSYFSDSGKVDGSEYQVERDISLFINELESKYHEQKDKNPSFNSAETLGEYFYIQYQSFLDLESQLSELNADDSSYASIKSKLDSSVFHKKEEIISRLNDDNTIKYIFDLIPSQSECFEHQEDEKIYEETNIIDSGGYISGSDDECDLDDESGMPDLDLDPSALQEDEYDFSFDNVFDEYSKLQASDSRLFSFDSGEDIFKAVTDSNRELYNFQDFVGSLSSITGYSFDTLSSSDPLYGFYDTIKEQIPKYVLSMEKDVRKRKPARVYKVTKNEETKQEDIPVIEEVKTRKERVKLSSIPDVMKFFTDDWDTYQIDSEDFGRFKNFNHFMCEVWLEQLLRNSNLSPTDKKEVDVRKLSLKLHAKDSKSEEYTNLIIKILTNNLMDNIKQKYQNKNIIDLRNFENSYFRMNNSIVFINALLPNFFVKSSANTIIGQLQKNIVEHIQSLQQSYLILFKHNIKNKFNLPSLSGIKEFSTFTINDLSSFYFKENDNCISSYLTGLYHSEKGPLYESRKDKLSKLHEGLTEDNIKSIRSFIHQLNKDEMSYDYSMRQVIRDPPVKEDKFKSSPDDDLLLFHIIFCYAARNKGKLNDMYYLIQNVIDDLRTQSASKIPLGAAETRMSTERTDVRLDDLHNRQIPDDVQQVIKSYYDIDETKFPGLVNSKQLYYLYKNVCDYKVRKNGDIFNIVCIVLEKV